MLCMCMKEVGTLRVRSGTHFNSRSVILEVFCYFRILSDRFSGAVNLGTLFLVQSSVFIWVSPGAVCCQRCPLELSVECFGLSFDSLDFIGSPSPFPFVGKNQHDGGSGSRGFSNSVYLTY